MPEWCGQTVYPRQKQKACLGSLVKMYGGKQESPMLTCMAHDVSKQRNKRSFHGLRHTGYMVMANRKRPSLPAWHMMLASSFFLKKRPFHVLRHNEYMVVANRKHSCLPAWHIMLGSSKIKDPLLPRGTLSKWWWHHIFYIPIG